MPQNDFQTFAGSGSANVVSQAQWEAFTSLLADGFIAGTARSDQANKLFRQLSIFTAMLASFIVDQTGDDVIDDGEAGVAAIQASFVNAVQNAAAQAGVPYGDDTGAANALVANVTPAPGALANGLAVLIKVVADNTGPSTLNLQSFGVKNIANADGTPLSPGQLTGSGYALFVYDGTVWQMISMPGPAFFASLLTSASYTAVDSGSANTIVASLDTPPASLASVLYIPISIKVAAANTGATTLNLNSLGATPVRNVDFTPLIPGQMVAGQNQFAYDGTYFILLTPPGPKFVQQGGIHYAVAGGTANAITVTLNPVPTALAAGFPVNFKATADNTGPTTINVNGLGAADILDAAGGALAGGEIITDGMYSLLYDGSDFRLASTPSNLGGAGRLVTVTRMSATGSYSPSAGASKIRVRMGGPGGGGGGGAATGGSQISLGGGGGSGSYAEAEFLVSAITAPVTVTLPAGGAGNSGAGGSNGASASFGSYITCPGGQGGSTVTANTSDPPVAPGGAPASVATVTGAVWSVVSGGNPGSHGVASDSTLGRTGGGGAPGPFGGGGATPASGGGVHAGGSAASGPGAGGGGSLNQPSGGAQTGGAGGAAWAIIEEFS